MHIIVDSETGKRKDRTDYPITAIRKGLDDQYYKTLIIEYLKQYTKANRKEIDRLLWDKLPDSLSEVQKKNKIHNLLTSMKNKNLIEKDSDNQQKSNWVLK